MKKILLAILMAQTVWAASAQQTNQRPEVPDGVKAFWDIPYLENATEQNWLDLYLPQSSGSHIPAIICIHGGGWEAGTKESWYVPTVAAYLASQGFVVASINYRLTQNAIFPVQLENCKAAIRWLRANASKYNVDTDHIGVWGESAGGHLAALLGTTGKIKDFEGTGGNLDQSSQIQCAVDWFGPTDLTTKSWRNDGPQSIIAKLIGGTLPEFLAEARRASPISYVSKDAVPFLVVHGDSDKTVELSQSELFVNALSQAGASASLYVVKGGNHGRGWFDSPESMKLLVDFFNKYLKN